MKWIGRRAELLQRSTNRQASRQPHIRSLSRIRMFGCDGKRQIPMSDVGAMLWVSPTWLRVPGGLADVMHAICRIDVPTSRQNLLIASGRNICGLSSDNAHRHVRRIACPPNWAICGESEHLSLPLKPLSFLLLHSFMALIRASRDLGQLWLRRTRRGWVLLVNTH